MELLNIEPSKTAGLHLINRAALRRLARYLFTQHNISHERLPRNGIAQLEKMLADRCFKEATTWAELIKYRGDCIKATDGAQAELDLGPGKKPKRKRKTKTKGTTV